jgi:hypothetical protein
MIRLPPQTTACARHADCTRIARPPASLPSALGEGRKAGDETQKTNDERGTPAMHRALRKALVGATGLIAALAFTTSGTARADAAVTPDVAPGNCFSQFFLSNVATSLQVYVDTAANDEVAFGDTPDVLCQAFAPSGNQLVIFDESIGSSGSCLGYNASQNYVYLHVPSGCTSGTLNYLLWKFIYIGTNAGGKYYELQNQYNGQCVYEHDPAQLAGCNPASTRDLFYAVND